MFVIGVIDRIPVAEHTLAKRALHAVFSDQVVEAGPGQLDRQGARLMCSASSERYPRAAATRGRTCTCSYVCLSGCKLMMLRDYTPTKFAQAAAHNFLNLMDRESHLIGVVDHGH